MVVLGDVQVQGDPRLQRLVQVGSAKRGANERTGVHAWQPFYAGYSEKFVADTLAVLATAGDLLLDPWNGSGMSTLVAQRMGIRSIGVDINPIMVLNAQAKDIALSRDADRLLQEAHGIVSAASQSVDADASSAGEIADWLPAETLGPVLTLRKAIEREIPDIPLPLFASAVLSRPAQRRRYPSSWKTLLWSALFQVVRQVGNFAETSNPTWVKMGNGVQPEPAVDVYDLYIETIASMLDDLCCLSNDVPESGPYCVVKGDARKLPILDAVVDAVITSPPYCTRIDYVVSTKPELLLLGWDTDGFDALRRRTMGAPVIVDKSIRARQEWGTTCRRFLDAVEGHPSKASRSYYLPTYMQYFLAAEEALRELKRVIRPGGAAVVVVQSSYYKDVELVLGTVYAEMALRVGFDQVDIARSEPVRQHMAHLNTRSRRYVRDKTYHEDVILVTA